MACGMLAAGVVISSRVAATSAPAAAVCGVLLIGAVINVLYRLVKTN